MFNFRKPTPSKPATLSQLQAAWFEVYAIARAQREAGAK